MFFENNMVIVKCFVQDLIKHSFCGFLNSQVDKVVNTVISLTLCLT